MNFRSLRAQAVDQAPLAGRRARRRRGWNAGAARFAVEHVYSVGVVTNSLGCAASTPQLRGKSDVLNVSSC